MNSNEYSRNREKRKEGRTFLGYYGKPGTMLVKNA
jgi:hypothetical protein